MVSNWKQSIQMSLKNCLTSTIILTYKEGIKITFPNLDTTDGKASPQYYIKLGTLLRIVESFLLYYDTDKKEENGSHPSIFYINHDFAANECLTTPRQISADPLTCLIPIDFDSEWQRLADPTQALVSIYARGRDYHKIMRNRLQEFAQAN